MYLKLTPQKLKNACDKACKIIKSHKLRFSHIAFSGYSGALVASLVATKLNKKLIVVRKAGEKSHGELLEGDNKSGSYIILDDFISYGGTVRRILRIIEKNSWVSYRCVGVVLYNSSCRQWWGIEERKQIKNKVPIYYKEKK